MRCSYHDAPLVVQFSVRDCTHYANKLMKTIWEMEKAATILDFKTIAQRSSAGFGLPQTAPSKDEHD